MIDKINLGIIYTLALFVPVLVLPGMIDNAFNTPKFLLIMVGAALLIGLNVQKLNTIPTLMWLLIVFNVFSLFYTQNPYYTRVAAVLNVSCLFIYYFVAQSLHSPCQAIFLLGAVSLSGFLVSIVTWLQFFDIYLLFPWSVQGSMVIGTIGNSNYLGAYFLFPLISSMGLTLLLKGKWKFIPILIFAFTLGAFIISRARAGWFGFFIALPFFLFLTGAIKASLWIDLKKMVSIGLCLICGFMIWNALPDYWKFERVPVFQSFESTTLKYRLKGYFPPAWELFKENPVFGTGLWSYRNKVYDAQARINERTKGEFFKDYPNPKPRRAHNDYLETLVDGGLVGAFLCASFVFGILFYGWLGIGNYVARDERIIRSVAVCSIIAILGAAFFFFPFRVNSTLFMTCVMLGIIDSGSLDCRFQGDE